MSVLQDLAFVTKLNPLWFVENHSFDLNDIIVFHIDRFLQAVFSIFFLCFGHLGICSNSIFECLQNNRLPFSNELYKKLWLHVFFTWMTNLCRNKRRLLQRLFKQTKCIHVDHNQDMAVSKLEESRNGRAQIQCSMFTKNDRWVK